MKLTLVVLALLALTCAVIASPSQLHSSAYGMLLSSSNDTSSSGEVAKNGTCASKTDCSSCTDDRDCVWCEGDKVCVSGTFYGSKPIDTCKDFQWMQCKMQGLYTLLIAGGIALFIIVFFLALICCCCCRRKKVTKVYHIQDEETRSLLSSNHSQTPLTDRRREEMRMKYGIGKQSSTSSWN
ncbi:hypothetical protein PPL_02597 [Heterostelium album PN500]|uniref:PSI domain-containing protein n=1 Tax=Heterostelium pallidum (strain ATCC 26659 / Pp 5 / PN500) TaxID=670386 RepID=D3B2I4_HETP5|nr:hypothetical protein PPL_02597 [Heterostelium album PN500]EFA83532.1 hypothetical protein PPL_02597 [Heterostelium album PN500]|eukprot:XP_020435649.1 hypothetical protein PPL_02597 [Heterostelium album PN500]